MSLLPWVLGASIPAAAFMTVVGLRGTAPHQSSAQSLRHRLASKRLRVRPGHLIASLAIGVAVWWSTGWPVGAVGFAVGAVLIPRVLAQSGNRDVIAVLDGLAEWTRRLADILASGAGGLENAITASARSAPAPITDHVAALAVRMRTRGLEPALMALAEDIRHPAAQRIVASLILRARSGGSGLLVVLEGLASSLREEAAMRRQVEADRAKARTSARALVGITTAITVGLVVFTADYLTPFTSVEGQLWMALVVVFVAAGLGWLAMLTRPRREPGILFDRSGS
jgi:tight adherence protein B